MAKISIVLPTYNGEAYIRESIESIIKQSFTDWELIIVNDCSKDATAQIISEYEAKDERIHVITNIENQKLPKSLNIGFANAIGTYYTWTSDDNIYYPDALRTMNDWLDNNESYGLVYCDCEQIDENGKVIQRNINQGPENLYKGACVGACFLYRADIAKKIGGYDPDMFLAEDYDYWIRIAAYADLYFLGQTYYQCRKHAESLTSTRQDEIKKQTAKLWLKYIDQLLKLIDTYEEKRQFFEQILFCMDEEKQKEVEKQLCTYSVRFRIRRYRKRLMQKIRQLGKKNEKM